MSRATQLRPLAVDRRDRVLACEPGNAPMVTVDGWSFGLDRVATPDEVEPELARIWARDGQGNEKDMTVLRQDALGLCE